MLSQRDSFEKEMKFFALINTGLADYIKFNSAYIFLKVSFKRSCSDKSNQNAKSLKQIENV